MTEHVHCHLCHRDIVPRPPFGDYDHLCRHEEFPEIPEVHIPLCQCGCFHMPHCTDEDLAERARQEEEAKSPRDFIFPGIAFTLEAWTT